MPNKPSDLLNRIPSVGELLEKPQVKALAAKWNRSSVAAGLRSFLDELRTDLQRRATNAGLPSARELAERAAQYVIALHEHADHPAINATGRLFGPPFISLPLSEKALERCVVFGREFVAASTAHEAAGTAGLSVDTVSALCRMTGAERATAVHSYAGAIWLALFARRNEGAVVVAKSQTGEVESNCSIANLASSAQVALCEVGSVNRIRLDDYRSALDAGAQAILHVEPDRYHIVGEAGAVEVELLGPLARERQVGLIDAVGSASLTEFHELNSSSVRASIAAGANLVIVRGNGLIGGPACGILLGGAAEIEAIESNPLFGAWRLDALSAAALEGTVASLSSRPGQSSLPVQELLAASVENLRNRAERIVQQLAGASTISSAEAIPLRGSLVPAVPKGSGHPSYGVSLTPAEGRGAQSLCRRLAAGAHSVVGRIADGRVVLDLRTVFPRQDQALVTAIQGNSEERSG